VSGCLICILVPFEWADDRSKPRLPLTEDVNLIDVSTPHHQHIFQRHTQMPEAALIARDLTDARTQLKIGTDSSARQLASYARP